MNVSMMDSYNLAWKLAHTIHGLCPEVQSTTRIAGSEDARPQSVLSTFEYERLTVAKQLIDFDTKFSSMFSGQIGAENSVEDLTHEEFLKVFSDGSGFTSGCGVEYLPSILVDQSSTEVQILTASGKAPIIAGDDYLSGILRPGRRLRDVIVSRYADANPHHLHDDFPSDGRYRILVFTAYDLVDTHTSNMESSSRQALETICRDIIPLYPTNTIELVALHPFIPRSFEWDQIPACLKEYAEMSFHGPRGTDPLYELYGVSKDSGAAVAIRPDGYVGTVKSLSDVQGLVNYFDQCLKRA